MVAAYVLIQTEVGKAGQVARAIAEIKGVHGVEPVAGPYDVIARAEARGMTTWAGSSCHRSKRSMAARQVPDRRDLRRRQRVQAQQTSQV